jgi:hypothetical protein
MTQDGLPRDHKPSADRRWRWRDDEEALRAASLSSPGFAESWRAGSPLNWIEFIARWQSVATDEGATEDSAAKGAVR